MKESSPWKHKIKESTSPFTPGQPVPVDLFVGRVDQIKEIQEYIRYSANGKQENFFLSGERGIGKSSLAIFLKHLASQQNNFITLHVYLGGVTSLEGLVRKIFDELLKQTNNEKWFEKIKNLFGNYISHIDLFNVSVSFTPPEDKLKGLVNNFPEALNSIIQKIKDDKKGIFIILDDINGISKTDDFANWYKSFVDTIATHYNSFPVFIMLIGLPEIKDSLSNHQPSLMRIFRPIDIERISNQEVEDFFKRAFQKINIEIEEEALKFMVKLSDGLPVVMQEIGDAVFLTDTDNVISMSDAKKGIEIAANIIGKQYLDPIIYRDTKSESYISILRKLGDHLNILESSFKKSDIVEQLDDNEKKVFNNFIRRMCDLNVIVYEKQKERGSYKFTNELYPIYIYLESREYKKKKNY